MGKGKGRYGSPDSELWSESEVRAIMQEVQTRKSVDTLKLFGGPNGSLPAALSSRTSQEVKECVDHCKGSFDSGLAPWVPKCGVPELLAVLASEAAFCRNQAEQAEGLEKKLAADTAERSKVEAERRETKREVDAIVEQLKEETELRREVEKERAVHVDDLTAAKAQLARETKRRMALEEELDAFKLKEIDSRRKLDRARLKVSAMRGEIMAPTMDALVAPEYVAELRKLDDDKLITASSVIDGPTEEQLGETTTAATTSNKHAKDSDGDMNMEDGNRSSPGEEEEEEEDDDDEEEGDRSGSSGAANASRKRSKRGNKKSQQTSLLDADDASAPPPPGTVACYSSAPNDIVATEPASSADSTKRGDGVTLPLPAGDEAERVEEGVAAELRVLRNRLAMHVAEAEEWRLTAEAEMQRAALFARAKKRLDDDVPPVPPQPLSARAAAKSRAKRSAAEAASAEAAGEARRKRRKGTPMRGVMVSS